VIIRAARGLYVGSETLEKRIGDAYRRTGHLARAVYEYRTLGNRIGELHVFNELAAAYLGDGQFRELTELIKRQRLAPTIESLSSEDRVRLALCLMEVGEYDSARREIEASVSDDRSHWIVEYGEGVLASRTQDWDSSRESLQRAIELDPTQLEPRIELASTFIELGQYDSARVQAEYVLEREPHRIIALGQLASVFEARSDLDRVKDIVSRMSVRISQWQGPQGGGLGAAGSCWYDLELYPGQFSISITARSTPAVGVWPLMIVSMGQEKVASVTVDRDDVYTFQTKVTSSGTHRLDVFFPNDSSADQPGDRNLYVDSATLQYLGIARQP
jgi:tetratricopeptide (TPR) repeat protein